MSAFLPTFCPRNLCPSRQDGAAFRFHRDGTFPRRADGRRVQRFRCSVCRRRFSAQSFRLDFGLRKPQVNVAVLGCLVSKVTHRQTARILLIDRKTVHHRLRLFGPALRAFHEAMLERARSGGGLRGAFSLDELETYEHDRRLKPLTVPVLIHARSRFVVHAEVGQLPARGNLSPRDRARKLAQGPRPSESRETVRRCFRALARAHHPRAWIELVTDQKSTYRPLAKEVFGARLAVHVRESSRRRRNAQNVLFPINHSFAMMRDQISRLVRRTWAASKLRTMLRHHAWIWIAWRNYVRPVTHDETRRTAAMCLGVAGRRLRAADLLRWRWPGRSLAPAFRPFPA